MDYATIPSAEVVAKVADSVRGRKIEVSVVADKAEALEKVKSLIPAGASVMNGASITLEQIGFVEYLKQGTHGWNNLHTVILAEKDPAQQAELRAQSSLADYFLGSVHAVTEPGQLLIASNTGSQLAPYVYTAKNVIWVVATSKIVPTLDDAMKRLKEYILPLEDQHMKDVGYGGTSLNKMLIIEREGSHSTRKLHLIFVNEKLGF